MLQGKRMLDKIVALILSGILTFLLTPQTSLAATAIEVGKDVSLTIEYQKNGTKIAGAIFDIYKVAEVSETAEFTKTADFAGFEETLEDLDSADWNETAKKYVKYIESNASIDPFSSRETDETGVVYFPENAGEMTTGLYLVVGNVCEMDGVTYSCDPFFICLPNLNPADEWVYDEVAAPKMTTEEVKEVPEDSKLPQTGMLIWPIPVLAFAGMVCFLTGWAKRKKDEA